MNADEIKIKIHIFQSSLIIIPNFQIENEKSY